MEQNSLQGAIVQAQDDTIDTKIAVYFDIIEEHSVSLTSQITDNWMENNIYINDHIVNNPIEISLRGLSGEVVYQPSTNNGLLKDWQDSVDGKLNNYKGLSTGKLGILAQLLPPVDNLTQLAKNVVTYVESSYNRYKKIIKGFNNQGQREERLRTIYRNLSALRESKTALIVRTPYETFDNMYIQSLVLRQSNQNYITDIELTLKQVYFVDSLTTTPDEENREKCNFLQRSEVENHGLVQGESAEALEEGNGQGLFKVRIEYNG